MKYLALILCIFLGSCSFFLQSSIPQIFIQGDSCEIIVDDKSYFKPTIESKEVFFHFKNTIQIKNDNIDSTFTLNVSKDSNYFFYVDKSIILTVSKRN